MAFPASSTKRTRSQTTLPQFFAQNLAASPMKQARKNASSERRPDTDPSPPVVPPTSTDTGDDSTMHDHLKRPPSPAKDAALQHQPDLKRPRNALFPPPKPSSLPHRAQPTSSFPASPDRRAKSVPPPASTVPLLDLNNVPPSPRRSPSKFRIASVPPSSSRGSSPEPDRPSSPDLRSANSPTFTFEHTTPVQPAASNSNSIPVPFMTPMSPLTPLPPSMQHSLCADLSLDMNATPVPASRKPDTGTPMDTTPRPSSSTVPQSDSHSTPTSLAHPSPRISPPKSVKSRMRARGQAPAAVASSSTLPPASSQGSRKLKRPQTNGKSSLLGTVPRSIRSTNLHKPPSGVPTRARSEAPDNSRTAAGQSALPSASLPSQPLPAPRARAPPSQPLPHQAPRAKTPSRPLTRARSQPPQSLFRGKSQPSQGLTRPRLKTPPPDVVSLSSESTNVANAPQEHVQDSISEPIVEDQSPQPSHSEQHAISVVHDQSLPDQHESTDALLPQRGPSLEDSSMPPSESMPEEPLSELSSLESDTEEAQPTDVSLKNDPFAGEPSAQLPDSPRDSTFPLPQPLVPHGAPTVQLNSSLSTLTQALDKLNARPPERPNTSMGFHRSASNVSDGDGSFSSDAGMVVPSGGSKGTGKAVARPGSSMSTSAIPATSKTSGAIKPASKIAVPTAGSSTIPGPGQKKLKQMKLMLPPAIPGTRTTRLRAAATAAAASAAGPSTPARTPAKDSETLRQKVLPQAPNASRPSTLNKPVFGLPNLASGSSTANTATTTITKTTVSRRGGLNSVRPRFGHGFGRVTQRVSKASSLPVVIGSPVKGGGTRHAGMDSDVGELDEIVGADAVMAGVFTDEPEGPAGEATTKDKISAWLKNASKDVLRDLGHASDDDSDLEHGDSIADVSSSEAGPPKVDEAEDQAKALALVKEKEARRNASRRASMASHLLSRSLSAIPLPSTPVAPGAGKDAKGKARAVSSTFPAGSESQEDGPDGEAGEEKEKEAAAPPVARAHNTRLATGALSTPPNAYKERSLRTAAANANGSADGKGKGKEKAEVEQSPSALAVLSSCRIFVDVKTDEGDDAGSLFVEMLRDMGAKIANRVGSRCTHVVFKNGLMSTLTRYRLLNDPKPLVVGIAWVVECVEQRTKVDEERFLVNLANANVAGVNKRRKSMLPKHVSPVARKIATSPTSSDSSRLDSRLTSFSSMLRHGSGNGTSSPMAVDDDGDSSMQMVAAASGAGDGGSAVVDDEEMSLPPLERARRRKSMLLGK